MAPRKLREVIGAVKDQTSIGLAKVASSSSLSDLEIAIVKATRHGQNPPNQCYVAEILSLTCYSRTMVNSCISIIARRLNRTKNWVVALKSLLLIQRLLSQGGTAFEQEIFFTTRRGTRFLNLCDFRDSSRRAWDYSAFVRTYALYLDELLEFRMQGHAERGRDYAHHKAEEEEDGASNAVVVRATPVSEMENEAVFVRAVHLMQLLERFLACRPDMMQVHDIFSRVSNQYDDLDSFHNWCKNIGIMRFADYPNVEKISQPKLDMMNDFIRHKSAMLLHLYDDAPTPQDIGDRLALALFDGYPDTTTPASTIPPWEAFKDSESGDWEMALVQSASHLSNQTPSLPQGFDPLILNGMYQNGAMAHMAASSGFLATGSASSMALGSAGRPATLALPAPSPSPSPNGGATNGFSPNADPFAASLAIAPPAYVQMSERNHSCTSPHACRLEIHHSFNISARTSIKQVAHMMIIRANKHYVSARLARKTSKIVGKPTFIFPA